MISAFFAITKYAILKQATDNLLMYLATPTFWCQPTLKLKNIQFIQEDAKGKILNTSS